MPGLEIAFAIPTIADRRSPAEFSLSQHLALLLDLAFKQYGNYPILDEGARLRAVQP